MASLDLAMETIFSSTVLAVTSWYTATSRV